MEVLPPPLFPNPAIVEVMRLNSDLTCIKIKIRVRKRKVSTSHLASASWNVTDISAAAAAAAASCAISRGTSVASQAASHHACGSLRTRQQVVPDLTANKRTHKPGK